MSYTLFKDAKTVVVTGTSLRGLALAYLRGRYECRPSDDGLTYRLWIDEGRGLRPTDITADTDAGAPDYMIESELLAAAGRSLIDEGAGEAFAMPDEDARAYIAGLAAEEAVR